MLAEGGIRERGQMDRLLGAASESDDGAARNAEPACDMVGMARPFYAEPRLGARLLESQSSPSGATDRELAPETRVLCENCNNCTVPQVTGAPGICRTPSVLEKRGELEREGAYDGRK